MWQQFAAADPAGARAYKQGADVDEAADRDPVRRLERLAQLHRQGALTDEEFETAKRAVLKDL